MKRPLTIVLCKKTFTPRGTIHWNHQTIHYELSIYCLLSILLSSHFHSIRIAMTHLFPVCFLISFAFPFLLKILNGPVTLSYEKHRHRKSNKKAKCGECFPVEDQYTGSMNKYVSTTWQTKSLFWLKWIQQFVNGQVKNAVLPKYSMFTPVGEDFSVFVLIADQ